MTGWRRIDVELERTVRFGAEAIDMARRTEPRSGLSVLLSPARNCPAVTTGAAWLVVGSGGRERIGQVGASSSCVIRSAAHFSAMLTRPAYRGANLIRLLPA